MSLGKIQSARHAKLVARYARLIERREQAIDDVVRISGQLKEVRKQLARYEKVKARAFALQYDTPFDDDPIEQMIGPGRSG